MKDWLKVALVIALVLVILFMMSCASPGAKGVDVCANVKVTGDKEVDDALYEKCQKEKIQGVKEVIGGYDKAKKKVIQEIKE